MPRGACMMPFAQVETLVRIAIWKKTAKNLVKSKIIRTFAPANRKSVVIELGALTFGQPPMLKRVNAIIALSSLKRCLDLWSATYAQKSQCNHCSFFAETVPWMSGLVNGLQNRLRRFESARHLRRNSQNPDKQRILRVFFLSFFSSFTGTFWVTSKWNDD